MGFRIKKHGQLSEFDFHISPLVLYPLVLRCVVDSLIIAAFVLIR